MHWFPCYSSDFIGATVGLSCLERSIYALMIILYYEVGPYSTSSVRVYRTVGCESDEQKRAVDYLLKTYFVLRDDGWYQEKAERVKVKQAVFSQKQRDRVNKRWGNRDTTVLPRYNPGNTILEPEPELNLKSNTLSSNLDAAREILQYLNQKLGKNFRPVKSNLGLIEARLKEKVTPQEVMAVIDAKIKEWKYDDTMSEYLRPLTLFNASKFHQYLGELPL